MFQKGDIVKTTEEIEAYNGEKVKAGTRCKIWTHIMMKDPAFYLLKPIDEEYQHIVELMAWTNELELVKEEAVA